MKSVLIFVAMAVALFGGSVATQAPSSSSVHIDANVLETGARGSVYSGDAVFRINGIDAQINAPTVVYRMRTGEIELPDGATIKLASPPSSFMVRVHSRH